MIIDQAESHRAEIEELLAGEKLPVTDLPKTLDNFIVAMAGDVVAGVGGVEVYEHYGLLRSLAVHPENRSAGIAAKILAQLENESKLKGLTALYLLTETAPLYFERKGFVRITRNEVPAAVQHSSEFSHVCPASAIVMKKNIA